MEINGICQGCFSDHRKFTLCHYCGHVHVVAKNVHGEEYLRQDSIHMPGWHRWSDGKVRQMVWVARGRFNVAAVVDTVELIPKEPESEMARYFRENPNASTD